MHNLIENCPNGCEIQNELIYTSCALIVLQAEKLSIVDASMASLNMRCLVARVPSIHRYKFNNH